MRHLDREPLDSLIADFAAAHRCPSVAWGVVRCGALDVCGGVGAVDEHTVYRIASMTKSFSAAAVLTLRDEGRLRLDDTVGTHAPELAGFRSPTSDAPEITIRDLLTMTSGLATDDNWADRHLDLTDDEFDQIVTTGAVFARPTGVRHLYSNFGFALLGRVVHRATGQRIQTLVTERLLVPLGMDATTWVQPGHDRWARPRQLVESGDIEERPPLGDGLIAPMGGLWTTVADLAKWVAWMDDAFPPRDGDDDQILRRSSRRQMQSPQRYVGERTLRGRTAPTSYGFGLRHLLDPGLGEMVTHSGGLPGYGSNMRWLPGRRVGAVAMSNSTYAPMTDLTALILDEVDRQGALAEADEVRSPELVHLALRLVELINEWDDALADELFADNVALDESYERRRAGIAGVVGGVLTVDTVRLDDAADATVICSDATGAVVEVALLLAPPLPHRIQNFEVERR